MENENINTLFTGQELHVLEVVDSTNNYAAMLLNTTNLAEGAVIMAHEQEGGRGQRGSKWHSQKGENLTISIVYRPGFLSPKDQFLLSRITAISVMETLETFGTKAEIKWPNDILAGGKKIAGILIENSFSGEKIKSSVIGIGLNVNQLEFPDEINATSLRQFTGEKMDLRLVLSTLCSHLEKWYLKLREGQHVLIKKHYHNHLFRLGIPTEFKVEDEVIKGMITGTGDDGKLEVLFSDGQKKQFDLKEISLVI